MSEDQSFHSFEYTPYLFSELSKIDKAILTDFGGGSPLPKTFIMAKVALQLHVKNYVEIGVYRGKSFFQIAKIVDYLGGKSYGIDPYLLEFALESDVDDEIKPLLEEFLKSVDFIHMYEEVLRTKTSLNLDNSVEIIRKPSWEAVIELKRKKIAIDMLHIDGNHDTEIVQKDVDLYFPLVSNGGIIILDDINWPSVQLVFRKLESKVITIFNNGNFAIMVKKDDQETNYEALARKINVQYSMIEQLLSSTSLDINRGNEKVKVSIIVFTYNQEKYIEECLEGILSQKNIFKFEIIIGDDYSTDSTLRIINDYLELIRNKDNYEIKTFESQENVGITKNLKRCLYACSGNYIAICEGDDYWIDPYKIQKQIDFLNAHPDCSMCFNDMFIEIDRNFEVFEPQQDFDKDIVTTRKIVLDYLIGNLSTCLYDGKFVKDIPEELFNLYIGDWMFNIYYSLFGFIGHVREIMSVYRKHSEGAWAGKSTIEQNCLLKNYIDEYNAFLDFEFDPEFQTVQNKIDQNLKYLGIKTQTDITIIDDIFPHPLSAFRFQEFLSYLKAFENIEIFCSGISYRVLGNDSLDQKIIDFKKEYPLYAKKVKKYFSNSIINSRLIYTVFLGNTFVNIDRIDELNIPFVFTLYPGGMFGLNNPQSDNFLRRITSSPNFRKVIVTQQITYDYLVDNNFCKPEQIKFIYGVVTPLNRFENKYVKKCYFGYDKHNLDICFVAHKYTKYGVDKGFDVFISVAKILAKKYSNIFFHVVGGFNKDDADITGIEDRIFFYGSQSMEWFDKFYEEKDIILSPNIPNKIFTGSFDGFPTGSCTDAGLREVSMFCTDEMHLNSRFENGKDIVIVPHDASQIAAIIQRYYKSPEELRAIAINGAEKIKEIYGYSQQILPRIELLKQEIESVNRVMVPENISISSTEQELVKLTRNGLFSKMLLFIKKITPKFIKNKIRSIYLYLKSRPLIKKILIRIIPNKIREYLKSFIG